MFTGSKRGRGSGFTLIELLVVIAIIGILASVVLASLNSARAKSRDARRIADVKQMQLAMELYYDNHSQNYPTDTDGPSNDGLSALSAADACGAGNKCIPQVPVPPAGANQAAYDFKALPDGCDNSATDCTSYHIGASLEGANAATDGDADTSDGFAGNATECGGTDAASDKCYDVTP